MVFRYKLFEIKVYALFRFGADDAEYVTSMK